jgi:hypothetical protein
MKRLISKDRGGANTMKKTIIVHDDYVEILKDGYNIIERINYEDELVIRANKLVKELMS